LVAIALKGCWLTLTVVILIVLRLSKYYKEYVSPLPLLKKEFVCPLRNSNNRN
jgi:hypothetical protein